jgi:hypothetical protein
MGANRLACWRALAAIFSLLLVQTAAAQNTIQAPIASLKPESQQVLSGAQLLPRCGSIVGCTSCVSWRDNLFCTACDESSGYRLLPGSLRCGKSQAGGSAY